MLPTPPTANAWGKRSIGLGYLTKTSSYCVYTIHLAIINDSQVQDHISKKYTKEAKDNKHNKKNSRYKEKTKSQLNKKDVLCPSYSFSICQNIVAV